MAASICENHIELYGLVDEQIGGIGDYSIGTSFSDTLASFVRHEQYLKLLANKK